MPQGAVAVDKRRRASAIIKQSITDEILDQFDENAPAWLILNSLKARLAQDDDAHRDAFTFEINKYTFIEETPENCISGLQKLSTLNNKIIGATINHH
jgi:hypothetical protein